MITLDCVKLRGNPDSWYGQAVVIFHLRQGWFRLKGVNCHLEISALLVAGCYPATWLDSRFHGQFLPQTRKQTSKRLTQSRAFYQKEHIWGILHWAFDWVQLIAEPALEYPFVNILLRKGVREICIHRSWLRTHQMPPTPSPSFYSLSLLFFFFCFIFFFFFFFISSSFSFSLSSPSSSSTSPTPSSSSSFS